MWINGFTSQAPIEFIHGTAECQCFIFRWGKAKKVYFCDDIHENANCEQAKKLSYNDRKNLITEKKCRFKCLKLNHQYESWRVKISGAWCNNRHSIIVSPNLSVTTISVTPNRTETNDKKGNLVQSLASFISMPDVILQTLHGVHNERQNEWK